MPTGLATRCPACATVFRVVPDQLRVSEGWVRCGRCSDVFNASESLIELSTGNQRQLAADRMPAPPRPPDADAPNDTHDAGDQSRREGPPTTVPVIDSTESRFSDELDGAPHHADTTDSGFDRTTALEPGFTHPLDDAPPALASLPPPPPDAAAGADLHADPRDWPGSTAMPLHDSLASARETPSFVRRANRAERWRQPRVRAALAGFAVLATLGLATQVTYTYRDLVAARLPATRTALEQLCGWLGCTVGAAHAIESFSVESSGLLRVEKSNIYKLSVALRNRAAIDVAVPAVELALTDSQGRLLARRVLLPAELGVAQALQAPQPTLAAGRELALQATVQAAFGGEAPQPVAGYTIDIFYP